MTTDRSSSPTRHRMRSIRCALLLAILLATTLAGCVARIGPRQVVPARYHYNQAIIRSWDEQFLLNLVRLRYHDTPFFLEISSVLAQYSISGTGSLTPTLNFGSADSTSIGAELTYTETPTITFTPLQDAEFVSSLLEPLSPTSLMLLSETGVGVGRLLACCIKAVGTVEHSDATDLQDNDFARLTTLLRDLEADGQLNFSEVSTPSGTEVVVLVEAPTNDTETQRLAAVRTLLGLTDADGLAWRLTLPAATRDAGTLSLSPRSLFGMLRHLSRGVEVPDADVDAGKVESKDAAPVDPLLRVRWAAARPADAFVAVHYRNRWFYLADNDLESKSTFGLLQLLFSIQAVGSSASPPLLTVSGG